MLRRILPRKREQISAGFVCHVREGLDKETREAYRDACARLDFYAEFNGERYCVLHCPGEDKEDDFEEAKQSKFARQDFDFRGAIFPAGSANFRSVEFDVDMNFSGATFAGRVDFSAAQFSGETTNFSQTQFSGETTNFSQAQFSGGETSFQEATFLRDVYFTEAIFGERVIFRGSKTNPIFDTESWVRFEFVRMEKPEQLTFNTVLLHPGWFINVDVRKTDFTDVKWYGMPNGPKGTLAKEIEELDRYVESPHALLAQACRRLSTNAEENREYSLANEFHYWSMDASRKQPGRSQGPIETLYWALSGYGVKAGRALGLLLTIAVVFAVLYLIEGHSSLRVHPEEQIVQTLADAGRALMYSLGVMARLRPEPIPEAMGPFQILVTVEGILGPLQIALFVLALRRKVMR
jgi:uncharacterized protein YjbI with pentapeptide repeats